MEKSLWGGIDGCKGGWVLVIADKSGIQSGEIFSSLKKILEKIKELDIRTAIDMPLGLNEKASRECDRMAAARLKEMGRSSVFPMPCLSTVKKIDLPYFHGKDFSQFYQFNENHEKICQRKIPLATFCIMNKLWEANVQCAKDVVDLQKKGLFFEFHPELFWYFHRGTPFACDALPKKSIEAGYQKRLSILKKVWPGNENDLECFVEDIRRGKAALVQKDDIIDAIAGAAVARDFVPDGIIRSDEDHSPNGIDISIRY